ncbi:hypothetical protein DFQ27_008160 [Actinomortierella ambigua]|uniref:DNA replication regulator Sld3 C-terminal domain-containing protein n=1 Tax=Actinomortierella ambigua TaxID=1343610 RepID=A0A9P6PUH6_9FUNG|nr:hypothetical protein DFQ27_008160 [Actinomortierella ambigua]
MVSVGGTRSQSRVPPNILFLIDTFQPASHVDGAHSLENQEVRLAVLKLKRTLLRIMLMFHSQEGQPIQWAFQFFNSTAPQEIGVLNNRRFQEFSKAGINSCMEEYYHILTTSRPPTTPVATSIPMARTLSGGLSQTLLPSSASSPCVNIRTQLVHSLSDFAWTASSSFQSPIKPTGGASTASWRSQLHKTPPPIPVKNYMFLVSPLPHSWQDLECFADSTRLPNKPSSGMAGPRTSDFLEMLANIKNVFFDQGPWERFVGQHLSLSWIDTRPEDSVQPPEAKVAPGDLYSFATIFAPYKTTHIQPSLGFKLSRSAWNPFLSNEIEPIHPTAFIPPTAWRCDLVSSAKSRVCELDLAESGSDQDADGAKNSLDITLLESVMALRRMPRCAFNKALLSHGTLNPISRTQILCQPMRDKPDQRFIQLLDSLHDSHDVLLLELNVYMEEDQAEDEEMSSIQVMPAALVPTVRGSGIIQVLEKPINPGQPSKVTASSLRKSFSNSKRTVSSPPTHAFSMAMIEKALGSVGVFIEKTPEGSPVRRTTTTPLGFSKAPVDYWAAPSKSSRKEDNNDNKDEKGKGGSEGSDMEADDTQTGISAIESIDTLCLGARKAYIKHLYDYRYSVTDFANKIIATSKEITSLASRQSIPIKEAMQALVNFIIQFLRISPAKLDSKYKQLGKELHIGKMADSKATTENYAILQDERPAIDSWKARVMTTVQDDELRSDLKGLKTKDTQIQIVQNLHIQMLIKKYELEEIRPMKRDPSVTKSILSFMDRLCITASIDGTEKKLSSSSLSSWQQQQQKIRLLRSPETPRSKDMDPAKRFFTRVVKRFYGASLPQLVKVLATKCGAELSSSLLASPRPNRTASMARSLSLGVLPRPNLLMSPSAKRVRDALKESISRGATSTTSSRSSSQSKGKGRTGATSGAMKDGVGGGGTLISEKSKSSVLNNPIFRNRQVTMTVTKTHSGFKSSTLPTTRSAGMPRPRSQPDVAMSSDSSLRMEQDEVVPQVAKLKLKKFYHDKESEEVLKLFRRKGPLSKADAVLSSSNNPGSFSTDESDGQRSQSFSQQHQQRQELLEQYQSGEDDEDDEHINALRGSTSWGVIKSSSTPRSQHHSKGSSSSSSSSSLPIDFERPPSHDIFADMPDSPSTSSHIVPATPRSKQNKTYSSLPPMFHRAGLEFLDEEEDEEDNSAQGNETTVEPPRTPTRRGFLRRSLTDVNEQWSLQPYRTSSPSSRRAIKVVGTPVGPGPNSNAIVMDGGIDVGDGDGGYPQTPTRNRSRQRRESIQMGLHLAAQIRGSPLSTSSSTTAIAGAGAGAGAGARPWPPSPSSRATSAANSVTGVSSGWSSPLSKKWGSRLFGTAHSSSSNSSNSSSSGSGSEATGSSRSLGTLSSRTSGMRRGGASLVYDDCEVVEHEDVDDEEEVVRSPMKRQMSRLLTIEDSPSSLSSLSLPSRRGFLFGGGSGSQMTKRVRTESLKE